MRSSLDHFGVKKHRWPAVIASSAAALVILLAASAPRLLADPVGDPQIFICQTCTAPPGGDPNIITDTSAFTVGVAGNFTLQNPLLIIVGVYDGSGTPTVSFDGNSSVPMASVGTYGLTANMATFTSSSTGSAFDQLGLSSGGSESFVNWSGADVANGFTAPTSFKLYAFEISTNLTSGTTITIDESGAALGSFIIAYDCTDGTGSSSGCASTGDIGQTVFTNSGLLKAPEPASAALLGVGLLLLGLFRRRLRLA